MTALQQQGQAAKAATYVLATAGTARKNAALNAIADVLTERQTEWLSANAEDVAAAKEAGRGPIDVPFLLLVLLLTGVGLIMLLSARFPSGYY